MAVLRSTMVNGRYETDGEHSLRLQFITVAYAQQYHPTLDSAKIGLYALIHDFVEVYAGDVNSLQASEKQMAAKAVTERVALQKLEDELGNSWPDLIRLIHEYETLENSEARFVKCFDKCDPAFTHIKNRGEALERLGVVDEAELSKLYDTVSKRMATYSEEFPDVMKIRDELHNRVKRALHIRYTKK